MNLPSPRRQALSLLASALFCGCSKSVPSTAPPFEWTNIVHAASAFLETPSTGIIVNVTNYGTWSSHYGDRISAGVGTVDYEATVFFNPMDRKVTRIVQQTTVGTNHYWLIDQNGDGLPDQRRKLGNKGDDRELLIRGEWLQARGGSNPEVLFDGSWIPVHFTNSSWRQKTLQ